MFPVNVVGIDGELQYGELERTAQSLDKGTAYRVMLGTDTTITEVDGSRILSTWQIVWQCHYISTLCFGAQPRYHASRGGECASRVLLGSFGGLLLAEKGQVAWGWAMALTECSWRV